MEDWQTELIDLRDKLEKAAQIEKQRRKIDLVGKIIAIKNELNEVNRKLKTSKRTTGDIKTHIKLITTLKLLCDTSDMTSPLSLLHEEVSILLSVYNGLTNALKGVSTELFEEEGLPPVKW